MEVFSSFNLKMMNLVLLDSLSAWNASAHDGSTATPERDFLLDHRHRVEGDTISFVFVVDGTRYLRDEADSEREKTSYDQRGLEFGRETNQKFFHVVSLCCKTLETDGSRSESSASVPGATSI
jgi:hypothetical protein